MKMKTAFWTATVIGIGMVLVQGGCASSSACIQPFNGKDLTGWKLKGKAEKNKWAAGIAAADPQDSNALILKPGKGELVNLVSNHKRSVDLYTEKEFGDCRIELEVLVPEGSNSGIYVCGEYEIQILDSYGKETPGVGDMGAVYGQTAPRVNASKAPGEWQTYLIEFQAARFDANGKKTKDAKLIKVILNGQVLHENLDISLTPGGVKEAESSKGPLMFQGNHGPVAYRNIRITPLKLD